METAIQASLPLLRETAEEDLQSFPTPRNSIPASLFAVAVLFGIQGVLAVLDVVVSLFHYHVSINFGVLALLVAPGLLSLSRGWRTFALVTLWLSLIGCAAMAALVFLEATGPLPLFSYGRHIGFIPKWAAIAWAVAFFALALWQYSVLTRPDVRRLFGLSGDSDDSRPVRYYY